MRSPAMTFIVRIAPDEAGRLTGIAPPTPAGSPARSSAPTAAPRSSTPTCRWRSSAADRPIAKGGSSMSRSLACLAVLLALASAAPAAAGPRHLQTLFVVTVDQGPSAGLVLQTVRSAAVDPATGVLAGTLPPGPDPRTGLPCPSASFTTVDRHFPPNPGVTALPVRG